jgi:hypothetical protein
MEKFIIYDTMPGVPEARAFQNRHIQKIHFPGMMSHG